MRKSIYGSVILFIFIVFIFSSIPNSANAQVYIPDPNLKAAIEAELGMTDPTTADMLRLYLLIAENTGIGDLTGLEYATNLMYLRLSGDLISDITPLSELTNLTELYLTSYQLSNIAPLSGLTNLTTLYLINFSVSDITALSGLTNLTTLSLYNNPQISNITALSGLTNLTFLYLRNLSVSNIAPLSGLTNLTELYLRDLSVSDITALSGLTNLTTLSLDNNPQISDITALSGLTNLTILHLKNIQISNIFPLSALTNLTYLDLRNNSLNLDSYCSYIPLIQTNNPSITIYSDPMNDTCFTDTDGDGVYDDGDDSGIAGDNTCIGGSTTNCDDNCVNMPNADQADVDVDGIGDVCDSENYHPYDTNQDWVIGDFELLNAIDCWADFFCNLGDFELLNLIDLWAAGCYHWDPITSSHEAGCGNGGGAEISGYWEIWDTGNPDDFDSIRLDQSGSNISGTKLCGDSESITGTIDGNQIELSWTDDGSQEVVTLSGVINGNTLEGTWSVNTGESGTWRGEKQATVNCNYPWNVADNVYRVYGSTTFVFPADTNSLLTNEDFIQSEWTFIGEANTTSDFTVNVSYTRILITWSGFPDFYFDAVTDEVAALPFGTPGGYWWMSSSLSNYLINTTENAPINLMLDPDGIYAVGLDMGYSVMTFPAAGIPVAIDPITGQGIIRVHVTTSP